MNYTNFQKFLSSFLIFLMLTSITLRIPIFNILLYADATQYYDIVSIIVDEDTYSSISSELNRYSRDISGILDNTRVVIMPVPEDVTDFEIASMNESLYFDWYKEFSWVDFESQLVWTVLVWNIPLAYAQKDSQTSKTILPYTDFEDKSYIYNENTWIFTYNSKNIWWIKPEIWHWVISPNTWEKSQDIQEIKDYFDKNNDFYNSRGFYDEEKLSMNWNPETNLNSNYEPYVFYFDSFREEQGLNYSSYSWYEGYLQNKEDIVYKRYTKELAEKLKSQILWESNSQIWDLAKRVDPDFDENILNNADNSFENIPDVQSRYIINNSVKNFVEVFSKWTIWELRKNVFNAWRYNYWQDVNVDFIPYLVTALDLVNDEIIKDFNNELEDEIDNLVKNWLSRKIAVPTTYYYEDSNEKSTYENYLFWRKWSTLNQAEQCSIYRWSLDNWWNLVEANRWLNINNIEIDQEILSLAPNQAACYSRVQSWNSMNWIFWMNTPFNIDEDLAWEWEISLKNSNYKWAILPLFDIWGSKAINDSSKTNSPYFCADNNYLLSNKSQYSGSTYRENMTWSTTYRLPTYSGGYDDFFGNLADVFWATDNPAEYQEWLADWDYGIDYSNAIWWSCNTNNTTWSYNFNKTFDEHYDTFKWWVCQDNKIFLDWEIVKSSRYTQAIYNNTYNYQTQEFDPDLWADVTVTKSFSGRSYECDWYNIVSPTWNSVANSLMKREIREHKYKTIPSYITHKSPESENITTQLDAKVTQSNPVDKNRYIDFIWANGSYQKIEYPQLFRMDIEDKSEIDFNQVADNIDNYLDQKSAEINSVINNSKPNNSWTWDRFLDNQEIYNLLKTWDFPEANFDLKDYLKSKTASNIVIDWVDKSLSYYDVLTFSVYWNNLNSVSAKYWYVFENYLSDQSLNDNNFYLPENKNQYEIAYLWAPWNSSNMYIWLDPESKWENPFSDIIWKNQDISTKVLWLNTSRTNSYESAKFKCAPPEWVPIWEWIPAVMCRLWDLLPPTIKIWDRTFWWSNSSKNSSSDESFSSEESFEQLTEELEACNKDEDNNWVNDCLEQTIEAWDLILESDSSKYFYNKNINLTSYLENQNWSNISKVLPFDIDFEIVRVESVVDWNVWEELFNINNPSKSDYWLLRNYVSFSPISLKTVNWDAKHILATKNKDLNIYLKTSTSLEDFEWNTLDEKESEILKVEVRWDRLFSSSYKFTNENNNLDINVWSNFVKASSENNVYLFDGNRNNIDSINNTINNNSTSEEKLVIKLDNFSTTWNTVAINYPLNVKLNKDWENIEELNLNSSNLNTFAALFSLQETWEYELIITDNTWFSSSRNIDVTPWNPERLDLEMGANYLELWDNISTNFITILDEFWNSVSGDFYNLDVKINWNWVLFEENSQKSISSIIFDWYKIFRLKTTDSAWSNTINVSLSDQDWNEILETNKQVNVLDKINVELTSTSWDFNVGWEENQFRIEFKDWNNQLINDFKTRVYMNVDNNYLNIEKPYFNVTSWVWTLDFETRSLAWKQIPIEIQADWIKSIITKDITILPWDPIKMDLVLSKSRMEANPSESSNLNVELKDKYNNLVFNDSNTNVTLEIPQEYSNILTTNNVTQKVASWKANYRIYSTMNAWIWYFKVSTNPSLDLNSFTVEDENWTLEVSWVWENAWKIETFYVWNKQKLQNSNYNSIYTTLLGSNYWDIDQKDYLAWSLIFDKNSKALAATSILNNPYSYSDTFWFWNNWSFIKKYSSSDLTQDISTNIGLDDWNIYVNIFNNSLNNYIWKIQYNLWNDFDINVCDNFENCSLSQNTWVYWINTSSNYEFFTSGGELLLKDNQSWRNLIELNSDWKISRESSLTFELGESNPNWLVIDILVWDSVVWKLFYNFKSTNIDISRDVLAFDAKKSNSNSSILLYIDTNSYWTYSDWRWDDYNINLYYNDPFATDNTLNTFSKWNNYSYENFENKWWLGWSEWNKSLLSFSAWETVWESVKNFASFSVINIWDPVVSLKKLKKTFNNTTTQKQFDSTIWTIINSDQNIRDYKIFDYNDDQNEDIIFIKNDWYIQLYEKNNSSSRYTDKWNLVQISDLLSTEMVFTWDFTWDWYDDIFFISDDWSPNILNNINKDFSRLSLINKFWLNWRIIRADVFDMDNDWIDDVVTLDENWEINIFYWWGNPANPTFTKLKVGEGYSINLDSEERNDWWFVYYDWLYQMWSEESSDTSSQNQQYIDNLVNQINNNNSDSLSNQDQINYDFINSIIYAEIPYAISDNQINAENINDIWDYSWVENYLEQLTFIKSEYSDSSGITVTKKFTDKNSWWLISWDIVDVEVSITNTSWERLSNIIYIEDVLSYFNLNKASIENSKDLTVKSPSLYDFMFDEFSLNSNETFTINYSVTTKWIQYLHIEAWLFEKWEDWDDEYWDILLKNKKENCWAELEIFRSTWSRAYEKWVITPACEDPNPTALEKNKLDSNNNWIPDYIEELTWDNEALKDYSKDSLDDIYKDSDNDWIPDMEDLFNNNWSISLNLWDIWENIDSGLDWLNELVNWMSCWFNNWGCLATPLNWAPLAPGWDPTAMWMPIWDGFRVDEWIPVFSAFTWMWVWPACVPTVWPASPLWPWCWATWLWAWGMLWTFSPSNVFRLFVTPTLTWWVWVAACFWAPASVAAYSNMPWVSPLFPGWNCIVVAEPILWCSNDWSSWNPASLWQPTYWKDFWFINWNCPWDIEGEPTLDKSYVDNYYDHLANWTNNSSLAGYENNLNTGISNNWPLFSIGWTWEEVSVSIDPSNNSIDYSDVEEIVQKRIQAFPWFLMNWVTRQIEEIVTKLTDFPTIFVVLPDFSWIYDTDLNWEENKQNWLQNSWNQSSLDSTSWLSVDSDITDNFWEFNEKFEKVDSWIKEAYEFLGSLPLVKINQQQVNINVPWITPEEIDKKVISRQATIDSWKKEIENAKNSWSYWNTCQTWDQECLDKNAASEKIILDASKMVSSLEANLDSIKDYKEIPEKINKLISKKEDYLEQILWNIESISQILWGWIWKNWERFKSWVELYVLIKATLKSWQLLVDVFIDYEAECQECKNERQDLIWWQFELISMVIPDIPVIQFPKWPDIIIDLHNIRAWMTVSLPEFNVSAKPIVLPELPNLSLPESPNVNINLPSLPILPTLEIPELPDLPSLPVVELPNLPPPPMLPKMFAQLEAILDILKLVTKAMCILKMSPFVPEWRAWDQIAFLTERNWYLPTDFLNVSMPQFSFPFVDAIKVTSYVNLEFETDFIVELARQVAMPINDFTWDFTNIFNVNINDLDFGGFTPSQIDINIWEDLETPISQNTNKLKQFVWFTLLKNILHWNDYLNENKNVTVSNLEYKELVSKNLADEWFTSDPRFDKLRNIWDKVNDYSFSNEEKIIQELQKNNSNKFDTLKNIINTEIIENKNFKENFNRMLETNVVKTSSNSENKIAEYNWMLEKYNDSFFKKTESLVSYNSFDDTTKNEIISEWERLVSQVNSATSSYTNNSSDKPLYAVNSQNWWDTTTTNNNYSSSSSCSGGVGNEWDYIYEWIYILEWDRSYKLFDYTDELVWDEELEVLDVDKDSDDDMFYFANNTLYLKENLKIVEEENVTKSNPFVLNSFDNKILNWDWFIPAVNNIRESSINSWVINLSFSSIPGIYNYRTSFYDRVDKFSNEDNLSYSPQYAKKSIIDSFAWVWDINLVWENDNFIERKDIVFIDNLWDLRWVLLETEELRSLKNDIANWNVVVISNWTRIYSWDSTTVIKYVQEWIEEVKNIIIPKNRNIEIKNSMRIVWVTWNWYVKTWNKLSVEWTDILAYRWMPLFETSKISYIWNDIEAKQNTYIDLRYYDWSTYWLGFYNISDWEYNNLWMISDSYLVSSSRNNDYYYSKTHWFKNNINWTNSKQILLSPQLRSDKSNPVSTVSSIKIPVYQEMEVNLSRDIYDNTWLQDVYIDFDLDIDSSWDWSSKNDNDSSTNELLNIEKNEDGDFILELWEFEDIFSKKIWVISVDDNNNSTIQEINFEVYSPKPSIDNIEKNNLSWSINENLDWEPVSLYRYRWWIITKLVWDEDWNIAYTQDWNYNFWIWNRESRVVNIQRNSQIIATVDEKTWFIDLKNWSLNIDVLKSNDENNDVVYPKIIIKWWNQELYYQNIKVNSANNVKVVEDFSWISQNWIYVQFLDKSNYNFDIIPAWANYNPGDMIIYLSSDSNKEAIFTIFKDWRINWLNDNYSLNYDYYDNYVVLKLIDNQRNVEIASVLYKVESDFIIN